MTTLTTKLNPRVVDVVAHDDMTLTLTFCNGEVKRFDMKPYMDRSEFFRELQNRDYFLQAGTDLGTVVWPNGQDLCPDTLYLDGVLLNELSKEKFDDTEWRAPLFEGMSVREISAAAMKRREEEKRKNQEQ